MQENTPMPDEKEDNWSLSKIPVAWLGSLLGIVVFCGLMIYVIQDGQRAKSPVAERQILSVRGSPVKDPVLAPSLPTDKDTRIDINTATRPEVESLPGIGPGIAREIMARRPFETVESLNDVPGIGPKRLAKLIPLIKVGTSPPANAGETQ